MTESITISSSELDSHYHYEDGPYTDRFLAVAKKAGISVKRTKAGEYIGQGALQALAQAAVGPSGHVSVSIRSIISLQDACVLVGMSIGQAKAVLNKSGHKIETMEPGWSIKVEDRPKLLNAANAR